MKEQAWSPEPWGPIDKDSRPLPALEKADYNRARACVNACAGIKNPEAIGEVVSEARTAVDLLKLYHDRFGEVDGFPFVEPFLLDARAALRKLEGVQGE